MAYTKIYLKTKHKQTGKIGKILAVVCDNKVLCNFFNHQQGEMVYRKLMAEGKKAVFERGVVIQLFKDTPHAELIKLMREDIKQTSESAGVEILECKEEIIK